MTNLSNDVQPYIRYRMNDQVRFYTDPCPCGSPFRSFHVEGRKANLVHIGDTTISALSFDLTHEDATRIQLVQTGPWEFDVHADIRDGADADAVFGQIITDAHAFLRTYDIIDVVLRPSDQPPIVGESGKYHKVLPLRKEALKKELT